MRDINRIEASLNSQGSGLIDIMIVIDTSGSMNDVINAVKQNVRFISMR
jgi:predicted metal-dependent peptidase